MLWRSVWVSSITCWLAGRRASVAPRPAQPAVGGEQLVDLAGELDVAFGEEDQVVADALEVGDQM